MAELCVQRRVRRPCCRPVPCSLSNNMIYKMVARSDVDKRKAHNHHLHLTKYNRLTPISSIRRFSLSSQQSKDLHSTPPCGPPTTIASPDPPWPETPHLNRSILPPKPKPTTLQPSVQTTLKPSDPNVPSTQTLHRTTPVSRKH
jgi:hypothetical protein